MFRVMQAFIRDCGDGRNALKNIFETPTHASRADICSEPFLHSSHPHPDCGKGLSVYACVRLVPSDLVPFSIEKEVTLQRTSVGVGSQAVGQVTQAGITDDTISGYAWPPVTN
ncbi:hypothetical protein LSTR_LSTR014969 [Laodelphax striatellus]|uniref:Uncharacterized protein n=1 Tax=Laodelphax striatellus TaxID=195883 RepID=A0A482WW73_LAOST|nr:hypothetical protein LSTR_LSTR014969 [Laodelphax striatellus]